MTEKLANFISTLDAAAAGLDAEDLERAFDYVKNKLDRLPIKQQLLKEYAEMDVQNFLQLEAWKGARDDDPDEFSGRMGHDFGSSYPGVTIQIHENLEKDDAIRMLKMLVDWYENSPLEFEHMRKVDKGEEELPF